MADPIYRYEFNVVLSGEGENEQQAWNDALDSFRQEDHTVPIIFQRKEVVDDVLHMQCDICGYAEDVRECDLDEWMPEVYIGELFIGIACPSCVSLYCHLDKETSTGELDLISLIKEGKVQQPLVDTLSKSLNNKILSTLDNDLVDKLANLKIKLAKSNVVTRDELYAVQILERTLRTCIK